MSPIPDKMDSPKYSNYKFQSQSFRSIKYYTIVLAFTRKSHGPQNLTTLYRTPAILPFSSIMWGRRDPPTRFRGLELSEGHVAHTRIIPRDPSCAHTHTHDSNLIKHRGQPPLTASDGPFNPADMGRCTVTRGIAGEFRHVSHGSSSMVSQLQACTTLAKARSSGLAAAV